MLCLLKLLLNRAKPELDKVGWAEVFPRPGISRGEFDSHNDPEGISPAVADLTFVFSVRVKYGYVGTDGNLGLKADAKALARDVLQGREFLALPPIFIFPANLQQLRAQAAVFLPPEFHANPIVIASPKV